MDVQDAAGPFDAGSVGGEFLERLETEGEAAVDAAEAVTSEEDRVERRWSGGDRTG